ncbi:hypothetical protein Sango_3104300 [Sesamum angolense]|uniref:Uncharacterized protein n=1 Tax=Sesamum angolense TaxID=2727404 RepID=A0AAE1T9D6_9LAMI|nr:hypothetical protein Sango_3104300 [Sesamum angolense]
MKCYEFPIFGLNGPELWPKSINTPPLPPVYKGTVGRPQKMRRREPDEPPASSNPHRLIGVKRKNKCRSCGGNDHNSKSCKKRKQNTQEQGSQEASGPMRDGVDTQPTAQEAARDGRHGTQVKRSQFKHPAKSTRSNVATVKINQSTTNNHTPVIVKGGVNFITLSNLRSTFSNSATGNSSTAGASSSTQSQSRVASRSVSSMPAGNRSSSRTSDSNQHGI